MMKGRSALPTGLGREGAQALGGSVALLAITAAWWALALWPVESGGPVWLERTRYVCFGVGESGLPDAGGWIGLIGGPAGMAMILAAGWRAGFRTLAYRARTYWPVALTLGVLTLGFVAMVGGAAVRVRTASAATAVPEMEDGLPPASYPRIDRAAPPLGLVSQSGAVLDLADLRGRPVLVTFAFAHCQTICPLVVRDVLAAREALRGSDVEPAVVVVTLDPWRDTPSRLAAMADGWHLPEEGAWVLSGLPEEVGSVLDAWQVPRDRDAVTGDVIHPSLVYVVDAEGRLAFASTGRVAVLAALLRRL